MEPIGRDAGEWVRAGLLTGLAVACGVAMVLAPDWQGELHAQGYAEFSSLAQEALADAEAERRTITNRLEQSRGEMGTRGSPAAGRDDPGGCNSRAAPGEVAACGAALQQPGLRKWG